MDPDETSYQQGISTGEDDDTSGSSSQDESHERTIERLSSFTTTKSQSSAPHIHTESSHDETKEPLPSFASLKPQQTTSRPGDTEDSDLSGRDEFRERVAEPFLDLILPASHLSTRYVHPASSDFVSNVSAPKLESEPLPTFETLSSSAILAKVAYLTSITPITSESMSRVLLYVPQPSSSNVDTLSSDLHHLSRKRALELLSTRSPHIMTQRSTSNVVTASSEFKSKKFCQLTSKSLPSLEVLTTLLSTSHVNTTSNESNKLSSEQSPAVTTHIFPTSTSNVNDTRNSDFSSCHKPHVRAAQSSTTMTYYMSQPSTFNVDTVISDCLNRHRVLALESSSYSFQTSTSNIDIGNSDSSVRPEYEVSGSEPVTEMTSYTSQPSTSKVITESSDSSVRPETEVSESEVTSYTSQPSTSKVITESSDSSVRPETEVSESKVTTYSSQPSTSKLFNIGSNDFSSRCETPNLAPVLFSRYSSVLSQPGTSREGTHEFSQNLPVLTDEDLRELEIFSMPVQGEEIIFQCDSCPRIFYSQDTLTLHKYEHSAKRIFTCSICKAVYNNPVNYAKHFVIHIEQAKHLCHICGRMFYDEYLLVRHLHRHSDEGQ